MPPEQVNPHEARLESAFNLYSYTSSHRSFLKAKMVLPRDIFYISRFIKSIKLQRLRGASTLNKLGVWHPFGPILVPVEGI